MSKNDITGDEIKTKPSNSKYDEGWERIFGKKSTGTLEMKNKVEDGLDPLCSICGKEVAKVFECERYSCPRMYGETT